MENARVFVVDDQESMRALVGAILNSSGHTVVLEASSLEGALEQVEAVKEQGVNLAILDACLRDPRVATDGPRIAQVLKKESMGEIRIVTFSSHDGVTWGDKNLKKPLTHVSELVEAVAEL
ncbi:MAG: response regulator [bacterium]